MTNPHSDIDIDNYEAGEYADPGKYDERAHDHRRHQPAPRDLRVDDPRETDDAHQTHVHLPDDDAGEPVQRAGNRAQRRQAAKEHRRQKADESTPLEREANGILVMGIDYDGETYWVPSVPEDWDARGLQAFEDGKAMTALRYILEPGEPTKDGKPGQSGYELLLSKRYRVRQINELFDLIGQASGFDDAGN